MILKGGGVLNLNETLSHSNGKFVFDHGPYPWLTVIYHEMIFNIQILSKDPNYWSLLIKMMIWSQKWWLRLWGIGLTFNTIVNVVYFWKSGYFAFYCLLLQCCIVCNFNVVLHTGSCQFFINILYLGYQRKIMRHMLHL